VACGELRARVATYTPAVRNIRFVRIVCSCVARSSLPVVRRRGGQGIDVLSGSMVARWGVHVCTWWKLADPRGSNTYRVVSARHRDRRGGPLSLVACGELRTRVATCAPAVHGGCTRGVRSDTHPRFTVDAREEYVVAHT
jgi:hypothetical protein